MPCVARVAASQDLTKIGNSIDPFVQVQFGQAPVQRTSSKPKSTTPTWDETIDLGAVSLADVIFGICVLTVKDEDNGSTLAKYTGSGGEDVIGQATVPCAAANATPSIRTLDHAPPTTCLWVIAIG